MTRAIKQHTERRKSHQTVHLPVSARDELEELRQQLARERGVHVPIGNALVYAIKTTLSARKQRHAQ